MFWDFTTFLLHKCNAKNSVANSQNFEYPYFLLFVFCLLDIKSFKKKFQYIANSIRQIEERKWPPMIRMQDNKK